MTRRWIALALPLLLVAGLAWAAATPGPAVDWEVLSAGGAPASSGLVHLNGTLGQTAIGPSAGGGNLTLGAGFWYGPGGARYRIYVPIVLRG